MFAVVKPLYTAVLQQQIILSQKPIFGAGFSGSPLQALTHREVSQLKEITASA